MEVNFQVMVVIVDINVVANEPQTQHRCIRGGVSVLDPELQDI